MKLVYLPKCQLHMLVLYVLEKYRVIIVNINSNNQLKIKINKMIYYYSWITLKAFKKIMK